MLFNPCTLKRGLLLGMLLDMSKVLFIGVISIALISCNKVVKEDEPASPQLDTRDDGTQIHSRFRLNYAGYLPLQDKIAVYLSDSKKARKWSIKNAEGKTVSKGKSNDRRENDFASGDSFFLIDFSGFTKEGKGYTLNIDGEKSAPFAISNDPYGALKYEFFDYFQDHRRTGDVFNRAAHNWTNHSVVLDFIADAGDQGYYTVNASEAQWALINLLETYPEINEYYSSNAAGKAKVYDELAFFNGPMDKVIFPGQKLAVAKFATHSNDTWAVCNGAKGKGGACMSLPETKATFSVARTLASMSRLHAKYGSVALQKEHYKLAKQALVNAETHPYVCLNWDQFGGEGGYYPNNDNLSLNRNPRTHRDPCASGPDADPKDNNVNDDYYTALAELYIAADQFGYRSDARIFKAKLEKHPHHNRVDKFFFGAVSTEGTLSLLTNRPKGLDLRQAEENVFSYANKVLEYQAVGYPGITFDVQSKEWLSGDGDDVDANFRWASNRMQLNDARIVMAAATFASEQGKVKDAARYTNGVLRVLDQISGTNAVALAMYTPGDFDVIEKAVTRTHDALVPNTVAGKMVLGPNNWTNSNDPDMPAYGSLPGMKMFALTGTGWSSREIAIDGNASLVPVVYFATELAPKYLAAAKASE